MSFDEVSTGCFARLQQRPGVLDAERRDVCDVSAAEVRHIDVGCGYVVGVAGSARECVNPVFETLGEELTARDRRHAGDVEHRAGLIRAGVFAPIGEDVDVVGDIGDETEGAFAECPAAFGER